MALSIQSMKHKQDYISRPDQTPKHDSSHVRFSKARKSFSISPCIVLSHLAFSNFAGNSTHDGTIMYNWIFPRVDFDMASVSTCGDQHCWNSCRQILTSVQAYRTNTIFYWIRQRLPWTSPISFRKIAKHEVADTEKRTSQTSAPGAVGSGRKEFQVPRLLADTKTKSPSA